MDLDETLVSILFATLGDLHFFGSTQVKGISLFIEQETMTTFVLRKKIMQIRS